MGVFSFRFLAICFTCFALTTSMVAAQTLPPLVVGPTGGTGGTGGSNTSSVCDPAIRSMLDSAGSAQAQRDIATISGALQNSPNVMEITCFTDRLTSVSGETPTTGGTNSPASTIQNVPCNRMAQAWVVSTANANKRACATIENTQEQQACVQTACAPIQDAALKQQCIGTTTTASSNSPSSANATFDRINLYAGATEPVSQVANRECHPGIPTGVKINGKAEIVCPNPGCAPKLSGDGYKCETY